MLSLKLFAEVESDFLGVLITTLNFCCQNFIFLSKFPLLARSRDFHFGQKFSSTVF